MLACISKNDRATLLFAELENLCPDVLDLGFVRASRPSKIIGALSSLTTNLAQLRTDMDFSSVVARDLQRQTETRIRCNIGITHVLQWGAMYAPVSPGSGIPYSIVTDGPYDPDDPTYPVEWRPLRWSESYFARQCDVYRRARYVFTLSEWARKKLIDVHGLDPERVVRIGWGPMFAVQQPNLAPTQSARFVSIGNQWQRKGMDVVAAAGHRLHLQNPRVETIIAGDPAGFVMPTLPGVRQIPRRLALAEVREMLSEARGLVVASRFDASPHILMEALQLGTPCIGTEVCGIPEAIAAPAGGLTVPPDDPIALSEAMAKILEGEELQQRRNAYDLYQSSGGWERGAQAIASLLG